MMNDEAKKSIEGAAPAITGINMPTGYSAEDENVKSRMADALKMTGRDYFKSALMGAGAGAAASAGQINPMAAFLQGAAAGLQAPAQVWEQKQRQAKSVLDATPFGVVVPEAKNDPAMAALVGLPYGLVAPAIQKIAEDSVKVYRDASAKESEMRLGQQIEQENKVFEMSLKGKDPVSIKDQIGLAKDFEGLTAVKDYQIVKPAYEAIIGASGAAGDKTMLVNFARMLNPTIRVNEGTMEAVDVSSLFEKNTAGLWAKAAKGEDLTEGERSLIRKEATRLYNLKEKDYTAASHLWKEKAAEAGFDPRIIGGSLGKSQPMMDKKTGNIVYVVPDGKGNFMEVGQ